MESFFKALLDVLKDTPVQNILVIAGIVFLLLSVAGQILGKIFVPPERQRQTMIIGCLLVVVGITLHVVASRPGSPPTPTANPKKEDRQTQQSKPQDFVVKPIPSLDAQLVSLRFFEGEDCTEGPPLHARTYQQRFARMITRDIFTELTLEHPKLERQRSFTIQAFYRRLGKVIGKPVLETYIPADRQQSVHSFRIYTGTLRICSSPPPVVSGQAVHIRLMCILADPAKSEAEWATSEMHKLDALDVP
jgi:hypothetical protein